MKVLYVAPRYHTNQIPVIRGWLDGGHEVLFVSQFSRPGEDYQMLAPVVLGYSRLSRLLFAAAGRLYGKRQGGERKLYELRLKGSLPPLGRAGRILREFSPDLVIVRERALYNVPFYCGCRRKGISCILYNQSPLWETAAENGNGPTDKKEEKRLRRIAGRLLQAFLPEKRMTPVLGECCEGCHKGANAFFVPFVMEPHRGPEEKEHFQKDRVQLLCVGRYEERKQMFLLLDAVKDFMEPFGLQLTIIGEVVEEGQRAYYERLAAAVRGYGLEARVELLCNQSREQVFAAYARSDLFVLPSTRERASISQLEAMSCALPVICSHTNGSACYVEEGINGYLFQDKSAADLRKKIGLCVKDRTALLRMGAESYRLVKEKYQFDNYYRALLTAVRE